MTTTNTVVTTSTTSAASLSEAERTRLARKDVQNRAIDLEKNLGKNLQAWYLIALNVERSQVQADRVGAMMATTQQQSRPAAPVTAPATSTTANKPVAAAAATPSTLALQPATRLNATAVPATVTVKTEPPSIAANGMDIDFGDEDNAVASDDFVLT